MLLWSRTSLYWSRFLSRGTASKIMSYCFRMLGLEYLENSQSLIFPPLETVMDTNISHDHTTIAPNDTQQVLVDVFL